MLLGGKGMHVLLFVSDTATRDFSLLWSKVGVWFFVFIEGRAFYKLYVHQPPEVGQRWYHSCRNHLSNIEVHSRLSSLYSAVPTYLICLGFGSRTLRMCLVAKTAQWVRSYLYGLNRNAEYPNWPPKSVSWSCSVKKKPSILAINLYSHSYFCNLTDVRLRIWILTCAKLIGELCVTIMLK